MSMPVLRYFGWVGSFLPALHFVANWPFLSRLPARHYPTCPRATRLAFGSIRIINGLTIVSRRGEFRGGISSRDMLREHWER